ncbi:hypothetical protein KQH61_04585 [bacterium]|nr:hypothetical protein [bacterium]MCB2179181.1 hypothetical protein [bacterium]
MDSKLSQKAWMAVVVWLGLAAATAYTSKATADVFYTIVSTLFSSLTNGIGDLFTNYGLLFTVILSIVLIFLIVSAWLGVVSYTFEVGDLVFGNAKEDEEEDEDLADDITNTVGTVARYLGFSWGLFFIIFLLLPAVIL